MAKSWVRVALIACVLLAGACGPSLDDLDRPLPGMATAGPPSSLGRGLVLATRTPTQMPLSATAVATSSHMPTSSPIPTSTPLPTQPITYCVQAGDTLGRIARSFGTSVEQIAQVNNIANVNLLEVGQVLTLPKEVEALGPETLAALRTPASATPTTVSSPTEVPTAPPTATLLVVPPTAAIAPTARPVSTVRSCCKYCCKGKACGDSCISRSYTCHKPPGCACNRCP